MSYVKNKLNRRKKKYFNILKNDLGVILVDEPSKIIAVCNGGLVNGIDNCMILDVFYSHGDVEDIVLIPGKSYSFVVFCNTESAENACNTLNHTDIWPHIKGPVFLAFVEDLPESIRKKSNDFTSMPPGLMVIPDFITLDEEIKILDCLSYSTHQGQLKNRIVKHYGFEFKYGNNNVDVTQPIEPLPSYLNVLWTKFDNFGLNFKPDQLTVNYYEPGQGIPSHVDTHSPFTDKILSLSLQSDVLMDFKSSCGESYHVLLPARSLCVMAGDSRYGWTHGITPRKSDVVPVDSKLTLLQRKSRTSLTFRRTQQKECSCKFPELCDSQKRLKSSGYTESHANNAAQLEESYVHRVYEEIASHFSETRHKPWPNVAKFVDSFPPGSIIADIGCGNGKYLGARKDVFELGCDYSTALLSVCRARGLECCTCNCLHVPLRDASVDGCLSIAVIHHLSTQERRVEAVLEMVRVLRRHGRGLIYVWAKDQERENRKSSYLKQNGKKTKSATQQQPLLMSEPLQLPVHTNRTNFEHTDVFVPWKLKPKETNLEPATFLRYYHVFENDELRTMCSNIEHVSVVDYYYDQGNWCVIIEKT